ncbi:MAG: tRNA uridine(34) 5-carboxymethylaminomethyl modification radical SAM/GNAT enzyme Elp3 [Patescibacteria group bacterium]|nr:tRNA uridine(34) 5-carboxymethylaminomethyl modification radical SAM/GNAT enzyme Elp3 [Patescibacteria group bacterium]
MEINRLTPKKSLWEPTGQVIKESIKNRVKTSAELSLIKRKMAKKYKIPCPSNIELLKAYHKLVEKKRIKPSKILETLLRKHPIRTLSGVAVITVLTKPFKCPGKCIYCPKEKGFPKSYLSGEPAAQRAKNLNYDPYLQVKKRIESLRLEGHPTDKIELIVLGGTFSWYPKKYQEWFIKRCFDGANDKESKNLKEAQRINERAKNRIIGLSIETRPDLITEKEAIWLRDLGVTKVEIGAQILDDKILKRNKRGHGVKEIKRATKILKDAGFKIQYHLMPNLFGSNLKNDFEKFKLVFSDENFRPDWLKIYPCVVCKGSELYKIWKEGKYKPYSDKELIELLIKAKKILPYWVRVGRLFRDISIQKIEAGSKISNLREVVQKEMRKRGLKCKCIRCREIREKYNPKEKVYLFREDYKASEGREIFLSFENKERNKLFAFLRLRIPSPVFSKESHFIPVLENSVIIRELHTYGQVVPLGEKVLAPQHRGLGKKLITEAEKITKKEFNLPKIAVISGIGVRNYFRELNYRLKNSYMIKNLKQNKVGKIHLQNKKPKKEFR